ncbi:hypothetical protein BC351_24210 [Paenibacillus ferrarius]|uniref:Uncharacterized protein n=1 Tax=Paenibacillus ferrarius TaxID=1469647 RepID=A0A1V4HLU9_9BACL|nr:hypothetical protein BC351_24210 [Paenibacillus ferrarius]
MLKTFENLRKCRHFQRNGEKNGNSCNCAGIFLFFQPLVRIMLQKDAQLQEFTDFGLNQVRKDA